MMKLKFYLLVILDQREYQNVGSCTKVLKEIGLEFGTASDAIDIRWVANIGAVDNLVSML